MKKSLILFSIIFVLFFSMTASVLGTKILSQKQITNDSATENYYPDIYEGIIVWDHIDISGGIIFSIYGYNLNTNQQFVIAENIRDYGYPAIWGDYVVWMQGEQISIYNLKTKQVTLVGGNDDTAYWPDIYDGTVVWSENGDIRSYNIKTGVFRMISDSDTADYPAINGDTVVWEDGGDIYGFNLKSSATPFLIRDTGNAYYPAIYGDIAVWQEGDYDIYGHNLKTGQEFLIRDSENPFDLGYPAIFCGSVVWHEEVSYPESLERYQIFIANLDVVCEEAKKPLPLDWIMKKFGLGKFKNN